MKTLIIKKLKTGYGDKLSDKVISNELSFELKSGETFVLMGTSGSGKTTLLRTILGIIKPKSGEIFLNDENITTREIEDRNIGYLPQDYALFTHMNVMDNISYGLRVRGLSKELQENKSKEMLTFVGLEGFGQRKIKELSGGEKQRVGLARALATNPNLLLLDEPLSNIDQVTKLEVATHMKNLFSRLDIPIVIVTHNHEDASFFKGKLAVMNNGELIQIGLTDEVMKSPKNDFIKRLLTPFALHG